MNTPMHRYGLVLGKAGAWSVRNRILVMLCAGVLAFVAMEYSRTHLGVNTDTANMISSSLPWRADFNVYRERYPIRDRNLVVVVDSATAEASQVRDYAEAIAARMRLEPDLFTSVFLAGDGDFFARNGLLYQSETQLEVLTDRLAAAQPMIGQLSTNSTGAGVLALTARIISESENGGDTAEQFIGSVADVVSAYSVNSPRELDWRKLMQEEVAADAQQIVLVQPKLDFSRMRPAGDAIDRLREMIGELAERSAADVQIRVTGTLAMEHEELDSVIKSATLAGSLSLIMVALVLYWALRSVRLLFLSLLTLLFGLLVTASLAALVVGHLNLLSVAFAVLYVGLGVDFILHIALRVKQALAEGLSIEAAIEEGLRQVGGSLVVCTLTTAAAFFAFIPTPFSGVAELGLISGMGMFVSFVVSITLLPALMSSFYRRSHRALAPMHANHLRWLARVRPGVIVVIGGIVVVLATILLQRVQFDSNPVNLRDPYSESVTTLRALAATEDAAVLNMVALTDDSAQAQTWVAALQALPEVRSVSTVDSLIPDDQMNKLFIIDDMQFVMGPSFADMQVLEDESEQVHVAVLRIRDLLQDQVVQSDARRKLLASSESMLKAYSSDSALYAHLGSALISRLPAELIALQTSMMAGPVTRENLPVELASRWLANDQYELIEITPADDITDSATAARFIDAVRSVVPNATGLPVVYFEAGDTVVASFRLALTYAVALVALLLLVFLRNLKDCAFVLVPIVCAAVLTAAVTVLIDVPFNFANIIALPLLVGVGVDNAIHMVHRMRSDELLPEQAMRTSTSAAVLASGLTTIASFGNLAFSSHLGMSSMGVLLTVGMLMTMLATLVFLPALLSLKRAR